MKVYNAAQKPIVVRAHAAKTYTDPNQLVIIAPGEVHEVLAPALPEFAVLEPYSLMGELVVRDWGPLQIVPPENVKSIFLERGQRCFYRRDFLLQPNLVEGVLVCYSDESTLIKYL